MSILRKNLIDNRGALKTKNIFGEKEPNIFFDNKIKSVNTPEFLFTNYLDGKKAPMVNYLKNERRRFLKKEVDIDNEYELKTIDKKTEQKKIDKIIEKTLNLPHVDVSIIYRLKSVYNPELQFFFLDDNNGNYHVIFIDIYHLVLPARDQSRREIFPNPKRKYNEHKNASFCMSNIFNKS